jgi:hypothetical protein
MPVRPQAKTKTIQRNGGPAWLGSSIHVNNKYTLFARNIIILGDNNIQSGHYSRVVATNTISDPANQPIAACASGSDEGLLRSGAAPCFANCTIGI